MAVQTVDDFLAILEKSKLVSPNGLQQIRKATVEVADAKAVAKFLVSRGILTRFQATQLLAGRFALQLGPYRLLDRIASSGTGAVYAAQAAETKQPVSLKVLPRKLLDDKETLTKLKQQVGKLKSLDHPAFCRAIELRREGEQVVLVLEPVEGESLAQRVQAGGPLPFDAAGKYVRQVAEALAAAHQQELVHGNVTPEILICDAQDQLKLIDVGTATLNPAGVSVDYAAPELSAGQPPAPAGDVYSLGCTLYFLLTGKPPFPEGTAEEKRQKHASELPAGVLELRPDAPPELMKLCIRMMAKKPEQRPELAAAVVGAIDEWLAAVEAPAASEAGADDAGQEEMTESSANEMTDPDVDRALAEAMAASDFDEHLDEPASQPAPPAAAAAAKAAQGPADEVDDVLAEAMAASEFDHAIEDEEQTEQRKARLGDVAGSDDDLLDDIEDEYEVESEPAAPAPEAADSSVATGGPKLLGLDLYRLLGVKEDDEPAAKKKKLIIGGVASGVIAIGLVFAVVKFGLPMVFGESGKSPRRGSGGSGRVVRRENQPPARDTAAQPANGGTKQPADGTGDGTGEGTQPGDAQPGEETPGDGTTSPPEDGPGTETPPDGTVEDGGEPGDGTGTTPEEEPGTTPGETPTEPPAETPAEAPTPFDGLAASIDLPKDSGSELVALGPVNIPPDADCTLGLVGAKEAVGSSHLFNLKDMGISDLGHGWIVQLSVNGSAPAPIGRFVVKDAELAYQWARGMDADKNAQVLRQLGLQLDSDGNSRVIALQTPFVVVPVTVDFQRGRMSELVDLGWTGDPEALFVEVTDLAGPFPAHQFKDDKQTIGAEGDSAVLLLGEGDDQILEMKVESTLAEKLTLSVSPFFKLASEENSFPFNAANATSRGKRVYEDLQETKATLATVQKRVSDAGTNRAQVEKLKQRVAELEVEQQALEESLRQLKSLDTLARSLHDKGKIHFRIFYRVGEHEIDLVQTQE